MTASATFELKQFVWGAPDRLEVSGTFGGLRDELVDGSPVLIVRAGEQMHQLPAVPDSLSGPPDDGTLWRAEFAWQETPVAFDVAELQLGADIVVRLPEPGAKRRLSRPRVLEVRTAGAADDEGDTLETEDEGDTLETEDEGDARETEVAARVATVDPAPEKSKKSEKERRVFAEKSRDDSGPGEGAARVGSTIELLAAQERVRELAASLQQTQEDLARARDDLTSERERHAGDRERFSEGLERVRESAEEALAVEQTATQQLGDDLRRAQTAIDAKDAALEELRGELEAKDSVLGVLRRELEAAASTRMQQESTSEAEIESLRKRMAKLEHTGEEADRLRSELERRRTQADAAQAGLDRARGAVEEARADAERLLGQLTAIVGK